MVQPRRTGIKEYPRRKNFVSQNRYTPYLKRKSVYQHRDFNQYNRYSTENKQCPNTFTNYSWHAQGYYSNKYTMPPKAKVKEPPLRAPSPEPGSEEYMARKVAKTSSIIMRHLLSSEENINLLESTTKDQTNVYFNSTKNTTSIKKNEVQMEACSTGISNKKRNRETVEEIHHKIMSHLANLNSGRKHSLINLGKSGYDIAIQNIQKQKRLEISRALRDIRLEKKQESSDLINSIIPDIGIKIEDVPQEVIEELSQILDLEVATFDCTLKSADIDVFSGQIDDSPTTSDVPFYFSENLIKEEPSDEPNLDSRHIHLINSSENSIKCEASDELDNEDTTLFNSSENCVKNEPLYISNNQNENITDCIDLTGEILSQSGLVLSSEDISNEIIEHATKHEEEHCFGVQTENAKLVNSDIESASSSQDCLKNDFEGTTNFISDNIDVKTCVLEEPCTSEVKIESNEIKFEDLSTRPSENVLLFEKNEKGNSEQINGTVLTNLNNSIITQLTDASCQTDCESETDCLQRVMFSYVKRIGMHDPGNFSEIIDRMFCIDECITELTRYRQSLFQKYKEIQDEKLPTQISITEMNRETNNTCKKISAEKQRRGNIKEDSCVSDNCQIESARQNDLLVFDKLEEKVLVIKLVEDKLIAATESGNVYLCSLVDGHFITVIKVTENLPITSFLFWKFSAYGKNLYIGSFESVLKIYDYIYCRLIRTVPIEGDDSIQCMEPNWGYIFMGCIRGHLLRYSIKSGKFEYKDRLNNGSILVLKATQEGTRRILIVGSRNAPVCIRDAMSGLYMREIHNVIQPTVYCLLLENNLVYCATTNHDILVFSFHEGHLIHNYNSANSKGIGCMKIVGNLLFASCHNGNVYVYDTVSKMYIDNIKGPGGVILSMEIVNNQVIVGTMSLQFKAIEIPKHILSRKVSIS